MEENTCVARSLKIVIIGGSIAGLMSGIALKHAGHNVTIIEREDDFRESHMAGVSLGRDGHEFMSRHDRLKSPYILGCTGLQILWGSRRPMYVHTRRTVTNWDTLYYRLRANFDNLTSTFCPAAPGRSNSDGHTTYYSRTSIVDITAANNTLMVSTRHDDSQETRSIPADYVIGADGPNSWVRFKYLPFCQRNYVGNVAWRGIVPESEVSNETRTTLSENATVLLGNRNHCICYLIPGKDGSLREGERFFNFLWYTNETTETLSQIMIDSKTRQPHHYIVPAGCVRDDIWRERLNHAESIPLASPFLELLHKIRRPFIQVITGFCASKATFEDGRVILVGDALSLYRPHTAFSGTQAAFHALRLEEYIRGDLSRKQFEDKILRFSRLHWAQSEWWGKFYQNSLVVAIPALMRYWYHCALDRGRAWWAGEEPLLRGFGADK